MKNRKKLLTWLFKKAQKLYGDLFLTRKPWGIKKNQLLNYPEDSFGKHLGLFLSKYNFELIPKGERHDAYHTLTGYKTNVEDEIALQYLCIGNGKRSLYAIGAATIGSIILPEYYRYYYKSFCIGKQANAFHHLNYKNLLLVSINDFREAIFSKKQVKSINS
ncbi:ubiquinone biosynthesis protein COQ4 [Algibacter sp. L1A34]|uniref:ubiquinone biosynthesis protein COQ4 n=1 Tax=Algibacter sp. L1A34 TaxID=2686365 RepID=UPI001E37344B|nr:ubiquinone biosynthesis protein COQ4 [Algibacter sp. L1A34]